MDTHNSKEKIDTVEARLKQDREALKQARALENPKLVGRVLDDIDHCVRDGLELGMLEQDLATASGLSTAEVQAIGSRR